MERGGTPPRLDAGPLWLLFTDEARPAAEASGGRGLLLLLLGPPPEYWSPPGWTRRCRALRPRRSGFNQLGHWGSSRCLLTWGHFKADRRASLSRLGYRAQLGQ